MRDRLAGFYHWDDRSALNVAVDVALSGLFDISTVQRWSLGEGMSAKATEFATLYACAAGTRGRVVSLSHLPVYEPASHELVERSEDLRGDVEQTMRVLGRSVDGHRVLGRCGGRILSVVRDAFTEPPACGQSVTVSRENGRDVARAIPRGLRRNR